MAVKCYEMMKTMYSKEYSEILDIFYGIHVSKIERNGETMSIKPEPYFIIDLPVQMKNGLSIYNCFEKYCEGERLEGDNGWLNEKTNKKEDVERKISFWSLPKILVLDLKRFTATGKKIQVSLDIEVDELDLRNFVEGYDKDTSIYELYGVCNHSGGTQGGHYTAFIKNANGKWYHFNDTSVSEVGLVDSIISPKAYVLFYRRRPT